MNKYASKIYFLLISMKTTAVLLFIAAFACAAATFIENDYGSDAARAIVYNSAWFEIVLLLLAAAMIANIAAGRMWRREKLPILIFHLSFLVILLGAGITRYFGFEGVMHIREGETSNIFLSAETYLKVSSSGLNERWALSPTAVTGAKGEYTAYRLGGGAPVKIAAKAYYRFAQEKVVSVPAAENGREYVSILIGFNSGEPEELGFFSGDCYDLKSAVMCFGEEFETDKPLIIIGSEDNQLVIRSYSDLMRSDMSLARGGSKTSLRAHTTHPFDAEMSYATIDGISFALKEHLISADRKIVESRDKSGFAALIAEVEHKGEKREIALLGGSGSSGDPVDVELAGRVFTISFGSEAIELPFSLRLDKFTVERYPGSKSPSSYESKVTIIDPENGVEEPSRIYMNHILIHKRFRFYQASFDRDERGTVLSVSRDPGAIVTYLGYALLIFGVFAAFFSPHSRFRKLASQIEKSRRRRGLTPLLLLAAIACPNIPMIAAETPKGIVAKDHADNFDLLLVQDIDGRIKPFQTLSIEALRKIARSDSFNTLSATQVLLGMMSAPEGWRQIELISLGHPDIAPMIDLPAGAKRAKFSDFFRYLENGKRAFKLDDPIYEALRTREAARTKLQKELIKVYERVDICNNIYQGYLARVIPVRDDPSFAWVSPGKIVEIADTLPEQEAKEAIETFFKYYEALRNAQIDGNWRAADLALETLKTYQKTYGAAVMPSGARVKAELLLNSLNPFDRLIPICFLLGFAALFLAFLETLKPSREIWRKRARDILAAAVAVAFAFHTFALGLRWFVSEHAPWSNGYESVIYIAWTTLLAGLAFSRRSVFALPAATLMSGFALATSHLSMMDPQITQLVPVLKSYWLTIHVSVITASYGFLGLCALLGVFSLALFILRSPHKTTRDEAIAEITRINEMSMMLGLALLTIGNFLGAIWANESWGRYWSWDPKETWTLVSMLIYAAILHFRFIPSLKSAFVFSFASLLAFGSILMTYFGVNLYLSGMHSYAGGDPVPAPAWLYFAVPVIFSMGFLASRKSDGLYPLESR